MTKSTLKIKEEALTVNNEKSDSQLENYKVSFTFKYDIYTVFCII